MDRLILTLLMAALLTFGSFAAEVEIQSDCVSLQDLLGDNYPELSVQCGFLPGDTKIVPSGNVLSALKRNSLSPTELEESYTVTRAGVKLEPELVRTELTALYRVNHPGKIIEVELVRLSRDLHLPPGPCYDYIVATPKFGSAYGSIVSGSVKINFSYNVKVYEKGYVLISGLRSGDELGGAVMEELIDVTNLRTPLVKDLTDMIAARSATKGKVLTMDMVQPRPEKKKGDAVVLIYDKGSIKLEIECVAEGNAVPGNTLAVRNPSSGKVINATYMGDGFAVVN